MNTLPPHAVHALSELRTKLGRTRIAPSSVANHIVIPTRTLTVAEETADLLELAGIETTTNTAAKRVSRGAPKYIVMAEIPTAVSNYLLGHITARVMQAELRGDHE